MVLDGSWKIFFDPQNLGLREGWFQKGFLESRTDYYAIHIPGVWEEVLPEYDGAAWYYRRFDIPPSWENRVLRLHFEAVHYRADVWVDGVYLGWHEGGFTPFTMLLDPLAKNGELGTHELVVRVIDPPPERARIDGITTDEIPNWRGNESFRFVHYNNFGGIWQSVRLLGTSRFYIDDLFVEPVLHVSQAIVHLKIQNTSDHFQDVGLEFVLEPNSGDQEPIKETFSLRLHPGLNKSSWNLRLKEVRPWSPEDPFLYKLKVQLSIGGTAEGDQKRTRFGMREFTIREGDFYLNGKRVLLKGAFFEGLYPDAIAFSRDSAMLEREIRMIKQAGFNCVRLFRKPALPLFLDLADELGLLIISEPANWGMHPLPVAERRVRDELRAMILRDRNHPSIVIWGLLNEPWIPGLSGSSADLRRKTEVLVRMVREVDPTRLIIDVLGPDVLGPEREWGGRTQVYLPGSSDPLPARDYHWYRFAPTNPASYESLRRMGEQSEASIISEFGVGGPPEIASVVEQYRNSPVPNNSRQRRLAESWLKTLEKGFLEHALRRDFRDLTALCGEMQQVQAEGHREQIEALRSAQNCDGYFLHAFADGGSIFGSGIVDVWRNSKVAYHAVREAQQVPYLVLKVQPAVAYCNQEIWVEVTAVHEGTLSGLHEIVVEILDETQTIHRDSAEVQISGWGPISEHIEPIVLSKAGQYQLRARLQVGHRVLALSSLRLRVLDPKESELNDTAFAMIDPGDALADHLERAAPKAESFQLTNTTPVIVVHDPGYSGNLEQYAYLVEKVRRGAVALFLQSPPVGRNEPLLQADIFPLRFQLIYPPPLVPWGPWSGIGHLALRHPVFEGLPTGAMKREYSEVLTFRDYWPGLGQVQGLSGPEGETIAAVLIGPFITWSVREFAWGDGRLIFCRLNIIGNLGTDPVAERLFANLVRYASGEARAISGDFDESFRSTVTKKIKTFSERRKVR